MEKTLKPFMVMVQHYIFLIFWIPQLANQDDCLLAVEVLQLSLDKATCMSLWGEKEIVQKETLNEEERGKEKPSLWNAVRGFPSDSKRQIVSLLNPGTELSQAQSLQVTIIILLKKFKIIIFLNRFVVSVCRHYSSSVLQ